MEPENPERGFKVEDRRRFSATGEARESVPQSEAQGASPPPPPKPDRPATPAQPPIELSFSTFVLSLSTQALILLGETTEPPSGAVTPDLLGAQQLIDILAMLQAKTRGNLDSSEDSLLANILYDLRMRYVQRAGARA